MNETVKGEFFDRIGNLALLAHQQTMERMLNEGCSIEGVVGAIVDWGDNYFESMKSFKGSGFLDLSKHTNFSALDLAPPFETDEEAA